MENMYETYCDPQLEVNLLCDGHSSTQAHDTENTKGISTGLKRRVQDECVSKWTSAHEEVENIMDSLQERHKDKYPAIQFRLWANMLQLGTHRDYENPPNSPTFGGRIKKKEKKSDLVEALSGIAGVMKAITRTPEPETKTLTPERKLERFLKFPKVFHLTSVFICVVSTLGSLRSYIPGLKMVQ